MNELKFKCTSCGFDKIEEVMHGVDLYTTIDSIKMVDGELKFEYGKKSVEDGFVGAYQCISCGELVADEEEGLLDYLKEQAS